jgi:phenylpropionate dioxygenase-like ring-hydroxylating dioxygenase large terminal subunit
MQREEQIRVIRGLMAHLDNDTNVDAGGFMRNPVSTYTCPERAAREWESFFRDYPQLLGLSAELRAPGAFFTSEDLGKPILCTRDREGRFRAFLNVCRHRGTIVEHERRGRKHLFSCPFHAWSYSAAGDLVAVPKESHFGDVDKSCHGLVELPAVERHGLLWVSANPEGDFDIDELLGELGPELAAWSLEDSEHVWETRYDTEMNWKLAIDTFGETYHFNVLHKDTLAPMLHGNCQLYDTYRRNHRMALCSRGIDMLRNLPESEWHVLKAALPVYYLFPNVQLIMGTGGPTLVRVYPCGADPNRSYSEITFYTHRGMQAAGWEDAATADRGALERAQGFADVIQAEDYWAASSSHKGALSGAQEHVLFGRNEPALHHYHNTYREALGITPLPLES